jgi:hypothetical protein
VATAAGHRPSHLRRPRPAVALVPDPDSAASHVALSRWPPRTHAVSTPVADVRETTGYCPGRQRGVDTGMAIDTSLPSVPDTSRPRVVVRAAVPEPADGQSADRSGSLKFVCTSQGRPCGWPPRTVTDADVAVCSRGSWSAHANAMGPGYLYCARRGFASDDVCTLPIVSCSVGPSRRARGIRARGIMVSCCSGGCGSNDLPRQGQNLDHAVVAVGNSGSRRQPATESRLVADDGPGTPQPRAGPSGSGHAPEEGGQ